MQMQIKKKKKRMTQKLCNVDDIVVFITHARGGGEKIIIFVINFLGNIPN